MPEFWGSLAGLLAGGGFFLAYRKWGEKAISAERKKRFLWLGIFLPLRYFLLAGICWLLLRYCQPALIPFLIGLLAGNLVFRLFALKKGVGNASSG